MRKTSSTNFENQEILHEFCDVTIVLNIIVGRWKLSILDILFVPACRYKIIKESIPNITDRILALQLKELKDGFILKNKLAEQSYELMDTGQNMLPIIRQLNDWGKAKKQIRKASERKPFLFCTV